MPTKFVPHCPQKHNTNIPQQKECKLPGDAKYLGDIVRGMPHGMGRMDLQEGDTYEGTFNDGNCTGQGTWTYSTGSTYVGAVEKGLPNGRGTLVQNDGTKYAGVFKYGLYHGLGEQRFSNGDVYCGYHAEGAAEGEGEYISKEWKYVGNFSLGRFDGVGTLTFDNGIEYSGEFKRGDMNGNGSIKLPDGTTYDGEFRDGRPYGRGKYIDSNGFEWNGQFVDGVADGPFIIRHNNCKTITAKFTNGKQDGGMSVQWDFGTIIEASVDPDSYETLCLKIMRSGMSFRGVFLNGLLSRRGTLMWPDGRVYDGRVKNCSPEGQGTLTFRYGHGDSYCRYIGEFHNGTFEGRGRLIFPDGTEYEGAFKRGQYDGEGKLSTVEGLTYTGAFSRGKPDGDGVLVLTDGEYCGTFQKGRITGRGTIRTRSWCYEGDIHNNVPHGIGSFIWLRGEDKPEADNDVEIDLEEERPHFIGSSLTRDRGRVRNAKNSVVYRGEIIKGRPYGQGIMITHHDTYVGGFLDGVIDGCGMLVGSGGAGLMGRWKRGQLETMIVPLPESTVKKSTEVILNSDTNGITYLLSSLAARPITLDPNDLHTTPTMKPWVSGGVGQAYVRRSDGTNYIGWIRLGNEWGRPAGEGIMVDKKKEVEIGVWSDWGIKSG